MELVYLKPLASEEAKAVEALLTKALKCAKITGLDEKTVYFDNSRLNSLIKILKDAQKKNGWSESPNFGRLRSKMKEWKDFNSHKDAFETIKVNDVEQNQGVFCAFVNLRSEGDVIVDVDAICGFAGLRIVDHIGKAVTIEKIEATEGAVYLWFAQHRDPSRQIDEDYEKHSDKEKDSKKGEISACTYPKEKSEKMLQWAVGSKTNKSNRMYFHDLEGKKLLIFWNEDGKGQQFHAYEVSEDNHEEIQKIWTYDDGRDLKEAIERIAKVYLTKGKD